ncbi:acyl-CoA dehydrogenase domain-containing protein [Salmonella enterica]|uniref:acyl-CoA dehydrogenase domain-containing protein n=1 Tax=Salmonella enterica TaxID=28901 RepID=UPI001F29C334|nr:acyl-CoA dehydrogenase domain-containing protein [Salmonella enterica]
MAAAQNNDVNAFDKLLFKHIGHVGSNTVRSFWLGLTRGLTSHTPTGDDATKRYYQHLNRLSAQTWRCCLTCQWRYWAAA